MREGVKRETVVQRMERDRERGQRGREVDTMSSNLCDFVVS